MRMNKIAMLSTNNRLLGVADFISEHDNGNIYVSILLSTSPRILSLDRGAALVKRPMGASYQSGQSHERRNVR